MSTLPSWPAHSPHVIYFRDPFGTYYGAEVTRIEEWHDALVEPPPPAVADIRLLLLGAGDEVPADLPDWIAPTIADLDTPESASAAARAWPHSPYFRSPGDPPEAYIVAGFQALCPPHPPCEPGMHARESLVAFLRDRPGFFGEIADEGRDGFDRRLRIHWRDADDFARAVLRERLRDAGATRALRVSAAIEAAAVAPEHPEFAALAQERGALRARLDPVRYFLEARDFDDAALAAEEWCCRYEIAMATFMRGLLVEASEILRDVTPTLEAGEMLDWFNRRSRPVGAEANRRLQAAVQEITRLLEDDATETGRGEIALGRLPAAFSEARLAAAAVTAALDVQRRRASSRTSGAADYTA